MLDLVKFRALSRSGLRLSNSRRRELAHFALFIFHQRWPGLGRASAALVGFPRNLAQDPLVHSLTSTTSADHRAGRDPPDTHLLLGRLGAMHDKHAHPRKGQRRGKGELGAVHERGDDDVNVNVSVGQPTPKPTSMASRAQFDALLDDIGPLLPDDDVEVRSSIVFTRDWQS